MVAISKLIDRNCGYMIRLVLSITLHMENDGVYMFRLVLPFRSELIATLDSRFF